MKLKCIGTGSSGNCYALYDSKGSILILDAGMSIEKIKVAIDYHIENVVGVLVTHAHKDHSLSVGDFRKYRVPVYTPYEEDAKPISLDGWNIQAVPMQNLHGEWTHTNVDGSQCPCYGYLIDNDEIGRFLYVTDTNLIKWRFRGLNHILIGCNYMKEQNLDEIKKRHVMQGHMELSTCMDFIESNVNNDLQNVILCHISKDNQCGKEMVSRMKKRLNNENMNVSYAIEGLEWEIENPAQCPF